MKKRLTQKDLIFSYYQKRPGVVIEHREVVDWSTKEWEKITGKPLRDPDRRIRELHGEGKLVKIDDGKYKYDPKLVTIRKLPPFTRKQKDEIFKRGDYKCAICGITEKEGAKLEVDHIKPLEHGGESTIENGQVLCSTHNYRKKTYNQAEAGRRMFHNLEDLAKSNNDAEMLEFCTEILAVYDKYNINGHVRRKK